MRSDDALERLLDMLEKAGVDVDAPTAADVERAWEVIRRFAEEPVEDADPVEAEGDVMLAQYGVYDWEEGEEFELDMTRQLSFSDERGEYSHMTQLNCTFLFEPTQELRALGSLSIWSFGMPIDEFFKQALGTRGFSHVRDTGLAPLRLEIDYSDV